VAAGAAESAEQGCIKVIEGDSPQIKEEEKSSLIISNFDLTLNLYLGIARRPQPVLNLLVGTGDAESQQPTPFRYHHTFWGGNDGTATADFQKPVII
jgi:hypothetical protein